MGGEGKWARRAHHGVEYWERQVGACNRVNLSVSAFVDNGENAESNESK